MASLPQVSGPPASEHTARDPLGGATDAYPALASLQDDDDMPTLAGESVVGQATEEIAAVKAPAGPPGGATPEVVDDDEVEEVVDDDELIDEDERTH